MCRRCTQNTSKYLKVSHEKSQILSFDTVVANEGYASQKSSLTDKEPNMEFVVPGTFLWLEEFGEILTFF